MIKLVDVLKTVIKEAKKDSYFNIDDYSADRGDSKKDQAAPGYSARSTGGTTIDRTPRQDFGLFKGKGQDGWADDEVQFSQELKSIVDAYHKKAGIMRSRGTTTRSNTEKGITKWAPDNIIVRLPQEAWEEFKTDVRTIRRKIQNVIGSFVKNATAEDSVGKKYEDVNWEEVDGWLKSIKVDNKNKVINLKAPRDSWDLIRAALDKLYPRANNNEKVFVGRPHELSDRQARNAAKNAKRWPKRPSPEELKAMYAAQAAAEKGEED